MRLDATTVLIWTLRILLPILFFAIYFKLKETKSTPTPVKETKSSSKNVYSRTKLLQIWKASDDAEAPPSLRNISCKDQSQAPELFAGASRSSRGERGERSSRRAAEEKSPPKEKKEKKEKKDDPPVQAIAYSEERMHLESLINYVAFHRQEQQRVFLPSNGGFVPPPPPRHTKAEDDGDSQREPIALISGAAAGIANDEAQMVLRGSMKLQRSDVAKIMYDQLVQSQVEVSRATFELMIDSCVIAKDLTGASDFMMKMEQNEETPPTDLMDKVMDLYTERKTQEESEVVPEAQMSNEVEAEAPPEPLASLTTLQPKVPMDYIMPEQPLSMPMFNWDAVADSDDSSDDGPVTKLSSDAPVFVPSFIPGPPPKPQSTQEETSGLSATAMPFEPQYIPRYDTVPSPNMWSMDQSPEDDYYTRRGMDHIENYDYTGDGGKGKGKQKGKAKGKGKGERESGKGKWKDRGEWGDESYEASWDSGKARWKDRSEWSEEFHDGTRDSTKGKWKGKRDKGEDGHAQEEKGWKPKSWKSRPECNR